MHLYMIKSTHRDNKHAPKLIMYALHRRRATEMTTRASSRSEEKGVVT